MPVDVSVLRVFTDADGRHGNPLGVVDAALVAPTQRQRLATELGYSETIFVDVPANAGSATAQIFTPAVELPFAGHPTVGASWWLRQRGLPVEALRVPAGLVRVAYEETPDGHVTVVGARADWAPDFAIHDLASAEDVLGADPADYGSDIGHYLWAWVDEEQGAIRSRLFAGHLGIPEDEATGSAAVRMTARLRRDLTITQGRGSQIRTYWNPDGWIQIGGRVVADETRQID